MKNAQTLIQAFGISSPLIILLGAVLASTTIMGIGCFLLMVLFAFGE